MEDHQNLLQRIDRLSSIGLALSAEKDTDRLLETILISAKELTQADAGSLYTLDKAGCLNFEIIRTDSLGFAMGGSSGVPIPFPPIPLYDQEGRPNRQMVVTRAALDGEVIHIPDIYATSDFDFSGTRRFDESTGYRSQSFLTVPMRNHEGAVIGVLQLINRLHGLEREIGPFTEEDQHLATSLASQAAVVLTKTRLVESLNQLLESLTRLIATAIDQKSPYTGNHCRRVPVLTMMLAAAAERSDAPPFTDFTLSDEERHELEMAAWLHDCGKLTTPQHLIDKGTKLEGIHDRIEQVELRFEILRRDLELERLRRRAEQLERGLGADQDGEEQEREWDSRRAALEEDRRFLIACNSGERFLGDAERQRIHELAGKFSWRNAEGELLPLLTHEEVEKLTIPRGTLTDEEKREIQNHAALTLDMLKTLPLPKHLKNLPEYAGGHHERMDGTGYPRGLRGSQTPLPARIMAIADIFEALTAKDRPYKKGKLLSETLTIMGYMKKDLHIDPDLFDLFVKEKIYLDYAQRFLDPEQIDEVVPESIPGLGKQEN